MKSKKDREIIRDLAKKYSEIASSSVQDERRILWTEHNSLKKTRPLVLAGFGIWNMWCREFFGEKKLKCEGEFYRFYEQQLLLKLFRGKLGDDFVSEPWIEVRPEFKNNSGSSGSPWGVELKNILSDLDNSAYHIDPPLKSLDDLDKLTQPDFSFDEKSTLENASKLNDAVDGIIEIDIPKGPYFQGFGGDISTTITKMLGLEELMLYMYTEPEKLHRLLAFIRDGVLSQHERDEREGNLSMSWSHNQAVPYAKEVGRPLPNHYGNKRNNMWYFCAAQEYTLISPKMHDEFLLQYQLPILKPWGLTAYGCCEDLTEKIHMLRQIPNLRRIAVTPSANLAKCTEQISDEYVISWRPNPTDMVCAEFDPVRIKKIIKEGMEITRGLHVDVFLKDVETVQGEPERLAKWVTIVRNIAEDY